MLGAVCVSAISISLLASAVPAIAEQPLEPVGKWDLDYGETQCGAFRDYGSAEDPVTLAIRPSRNGDTYEILVARRSRGPAFAEELRGSVDFGQGPIKAWLLRYGSASKALEIYQFRISAAEMAQARSAASVTLHVTGAPDFAFSLEVIPQLLSGLETCTADLKRYWNMDGEETGQIAKGARGDVREVFTWGDYPSEALNRGQEGDAQFLLLIDENGKVAGCHVLIASGVPALDAMGCSVIRNRARFKPAVDSAGKPTRSTVVTPKVSWRLG